MSQFQFVPTIYVTKIRINILKKKHLFSSMSIVYGSEQHAKLPIVIKIPVTLWQTVYM